MILQKGTLWKSVLRTTERALATGALVSVPTNAVFIYEGGVNYFVRVLSMLSLKDEARKKQQAAAIAGKPVNPFLPPEGELTVADISETHLAILNKFNVVNHHLLIITRNYEDQDTLLTQQDFEALWACMAEYNSLGFYNGGRDAGASQQHKHLQLVPLPLAPQGPVVPVEPLIEKASTRGIGCVPDFPFRHTFTRFDDDLSGDPLRAATVMFRLYGDMLAHLGMASPPSPRHSQPYCFIVTRTWMLIVPRSREFFEDVSLNSLAFAGSFFVKNEQQLERLAATGPMNALTSVAFPRKRT